MNKRKKTKQKREKASTLKKLVMKYGKSGKYIADSTM